VDDTPLTAALQAQHIKSSLKIQPEPYQSKGWRSSGLSSCMRKTAYGMLGFPETGDTYTESYKLMADMGTAIHARLQEQAVQAGIVYRYPGIGHAIELKLSDCCAPEQRADMERWNLTGHIDGILRRARGDLVCWDIKTAEPKYFAPGYRWLDDKLQGYAVQISSYLWAFATPDGERCTNGLIYLVNRGNTDERLLFELPWQPDVFRRDQKRLEAAVSAVKAKSLPAPEISSACTRFCAWQQRCLADRAERLVS
jgi:hypothetical protein